ncbi:MAG TPA: MFS transporter [Terriglobales bacterium]|nr:MFS transporter [Terriglobales bacterium]
MPTLAAKRKLAPGMGAVLALLGVAVFINYIDRGSLSTAAPMLKDEFHLSASQLGVLLSAFFFTYACFQLVSGWLVDHFDVKWVMAVGFLVWSVATAVTGLVTGFALLLVARLVLGMGESVAYPSVSKILARKFPEEQRGFANSAIVAGQAGGPAFGMFTGGMLMATFGWRWFFLGMGLLSLLWLVPWMRWMPATPKGETAADGPSTGVLEILKQRSAWGTCAGLFFCNYLSYFLLTWMPFYLVHARQFRMQNMAEITGAAYGSAAIIGVICGWASDRWLTKGTSPTVVRKTFTAAGMAVAAVGLLGCVSAVPGIVIAMVILATIGYGICSSNLWAITQTLAGPHAAGRWTGVQNFMGNLAGVIAPSVTGYVVDKTGEFYLAFVIAAVMCALGALSWVFFVGKVRQVEWKSARVELVES